MINNFNYYIFELLNAPEHPSALELYISIFFAKYAIFSIPFIIGYGWLKGNESFRKLLLEACISGLLALGIAQLIGTIWPHPRPFMMGIGHTLLFHIADASFPSDHLTLLWAIAFSFILYHPTRLIGVGMTIFGIPVAWARIYVGVHFPFDIAGAALVGFVGAKLGSYLPAWFFSYIYNVVDFFYQRISHIFIKSRSTQ